MQTHTGKDTHYYVTFCVIEVSPLLGVTCRLRCVSVPTFTARSYAECGYATQYIVSILSVRLHVRLWRSGMFFIKVKSSKILVESWTSFVRPFNIHISMSRLLKISGELADKKSQPGQPCFQTTFLNRELRPTCRRQFYRKCPPSLYIIYLFIFIILNVYFSGKQKSTDTSDQSTPVFGERQNHRVHVQGIKAVNQ